MRDCLNFLYETSYSKIVHRCETHLFFLKTKTK